MRVLVVYYTQSGQLKEIIDSVVAPLTPDSNIVVDYEELRPVSDYPFPWADAFFDCFPECVMDIPCALHPFSFDPETEYDLIILACQSWFLSPSIPVASFLKTTEAQKLLRGRRVVTLHGIRNMWVSAQEIIRQKLFAAGARLVGNIVLADRHNNWIAAITIVRWLVHGKRGPTGILPRAGVSDADIKNASRFGEILLDSIKKNSYDDLQQKLVAAGAVRVKFDLLLIERNARKIFVKFARNVLHRSTISAEKRSAGVSIFKGYLLFALFLLSPIVSVIFTIAGLLIYPVARKLIKYYQGILLKS